MGFGERLKELRTATGMSQPKLAQAAGVSLRTIQNYESGSRRPSNVEIISKIASVLNTSVNELLDEQDYLTMEAYEKGGAKSARDMCVLVQRVAAMFAGGDLDDVDKDAAMRAISDSYWAAKDKNKRHIPKKYRKDKQSEENPDD